MPDTKRAAIWTAVSSQRQAADDKISLEYQQQRAADWCAANGYEVVCILTVDGHSRSNPNIVKLLEDYQRINVHAYRDLQRLWETDGFDVLVGYSTDRLGRSGTMIHWVIECTIAAGKSLYLTDDGGWVTKENARYKALFGTAQATMPMDQLKAKTIAAKDAMLFDGLPSGRWPQTHLPVRDEKTGRVLRLIVNEDMRPVYTAIAQLLCARVPWSKLPLRLYKDYGYLASSGKLYNQSTIRQTVLNPLAYGHMARHQTRQRDDGLRGRWIFDEDVPPPTGVTMAYNVVPAMYEGEEAEALKAELRRRFDIKGRGKPGTSHRFSRLCVCGVCGSYLSALVKVGSRYVGYRCCAYSDAMETRCTNYRAVLNRTIQAAVTEILERAMRDAGETRLEAARTSEADTFEAQAARLNSQIERLIDEQSLAPASVQKTYRTKIEKLSQELEALTQRQANVAREKAAQARVQANQRETISFIRDMRLEDFWKLPDPEINQHLLRFFGDLRLVVNDKQIVSLRERKKR